MMNLQVKYWIPSAETDWTINFQVVFCLQIPYTIFKFQAGFCSPETGWILKFQTSFRSAETGWILKFQSSFCLRNLRNHQVPVRFPLRNHLVSLRKPHLIWATPFPPQLRKPQFSQLKPRWNYTETWRFRKVSVKIPISETTFYMQWTGANYAVFDLTRPSTLGANALPTGPPKRLKQEDINDRTKRILKKTTKKTEVLSDVIEG